MGRLMGSSNSNNYGEQIFINKASEYLDDTNIIYWNRQLFGKEFDVCILMPEKGILVVELKGWREENILRIENNDSVIIQTNDRVDHRNDIPEIIIHYNGSLVNGFCLFSVCLEETNMHKQTVRLSFVNNGPGV